VGKILKRHTFGRLRRRLENNIKMHQGDRQNNKITKVETGRQNGRKQISIIIISAYSHNPRGQRYVERHRNRSQDHF
jgi:hypothetical protein